MSETVTVLLSQVDRIPTTKEETVLQFDNGDNEKVSFIRSKKRRIKDKRQERLLKFQHKLVQTSGLPPSRLMQQKRNRLDDIERSLQDGFDNLGSPLAVQLIYSGQEVLVEE